MAAITAEKRKAMEDEMSRFEQEIQVHPGYAPPGLFDDDDDDEGEDFDGNPVETFPLRRYDDDDDDDDLDEEDRLVKRVSPPPLAPPPMPPLLVNAGAPPPLRPPPPPPAFIPHQLRFPRPPHPPPHPPEMRPMHPPFHPQHRGLSGSPMMHGPTPGPLGVSSCPPLGGAPPPPPPRFGPPSYPRHPAESHPVLTPPMSSMCPERHPMLPNPHIMPALPMAFANRPPMPSAQFAVTTASPHIAAPPPPPSEDSADKPKIVYSAAPVRNKPENHDSNETKNNNDIKKSKKKKLKTAGDVDQSIDIAEVISNITGTSRLHSSNVPQDTVIDPLKTSFVPQQTLPPVLSTAVPIVNQTRPEISFNPKTGEKIISGVVQPNPKKEKDKKDRKKKYMRSAGGSTWEDPTLGEWDTDDFRIFCGDLGNEVSDDILTKAFNRYSSFQKARVIRDKKTNKTKGFGFVSFKDPTDFMRAMREMNGKYVGNRPIKLRKSTWRDRGADNVRRKEKEKKMLGFK